MKLLHLRPTLPLEDRYNTDSLKFILGIKLRSLTQRLLIGVTEQMKNYKLLENNLRKKYISLNCFAKSIYLTIGNFTLCTYTSDGFR